MCELKLKTKFKVGDMVHLIPTSYLKYFEDHGAMDGKIKRVLSSVHSEYVPEYSMSLKRRGRSNNHPLQAETKTYATKEILLF
ncbi:hypothetical protein [Weissella paramesenteroides]|uniref:hypothetical protein n=1 Tax=Weissella paramesenteroides TaxID=1249 RepID=UPI00388E22B3